MPTRELKALLALGAAILAAPSGGFAFDTQGHEVIEVTAYRSLVEGRDAQPARPEVLRDLINDGALVPPICFGRGPNLPKRCRSVELENPLLQWLQPMTDGPDRNYVRQFNEAGQCVHFMGMLADEKPPLLPGRHVPRALATTAVVRCNNMLDDIMRQVVIVGGVGTRKSGYGLYELMHAVTDSFSYAHTERRPGTHQIDFLRVWAPTVTLAMSRLGNYFADSPLQHDADDPRDSAYVRNFAEVNGLPCKDLTDLPYTVQLACLSEEGDLARQALVELLVVVHDLRQAQLASPPGVATRPEDSEAWRRFKARWFTPVNPCQGEECQAKQPSELVQASGLLFGGGTTFNPSRNFQEVTGHLRLTQWSQQASAFVFGLSVEGGYRRGFGTGTNQGLVGAGLLLELPFDRRSAVGFSPLAWRYAFGSKGSWELFTQALHYEFHAGENLSVSVLGPVEFDWRRVAVEWSFGVVVGYTPSRKRVAGGHLIGPPVEAPQRHDDQWAPEPLWFGRLKGRESGWFLFVDATPIPDTFSANSVLMGGLWALGAELAWDRDPWGGRLPVSYGGSLEVGLRNTSPATSYLTAAAAFEVRWNFSKVLGLSIVPVRIEGGPMVRGVALADQAPGVHGRPGSQYFLMAGSRVGVALSAGMVDVLVQAPMLSWRASRPFNTGEILSLRVALRPGGRRRRAGRPGQERRLRCSTSIRSVR
jgi:hypothetical protein